MHLLGKWWEDADTTRDGGSTWMAGERIDIGQTKAGRWRHKGIAFLGQAQQSVISGIVPADETYFRRNDKASTSGVTLYTA